MTERDEVVDRNWEEFLAFLYELPAKLKPGRQGIRVVRDNLQALVEEMVLPTLTSQEERELFPLGFSPTESDLKIAAGVGIERQLISPKDYERALRADKAAGPFGFLQTSSGKTFGESVAPLIAEFWIRGPNDGFAKMPNTALYDVGWTPSDTGRLLRIELKASSESNPRFQQIRHPRMTTPDAPEPEYDVLLCLGLSNAGLEWWAFSADDIVNLIASGQLVLQHGAGKTDSGTYWLTMKRKVRDTFTARQASSETLRAFLLRL
jgi:hypothetical protein